MSDVATTDSIRWSTVGHDGSRYSLLAGDPTSPGTAYTYALALPAGYSGHYCFDTAAEVTVIRGRLLQGDATAGPPWKRGYDAGIRVTLAPGTVYSLATDRASIVVVRREAPIPIGQEPGAPATSEMRGGRC